MTSTAQMLPCGGELFAQGAILHLPVTISYQSSLAKRLVQALPKPEAHR
jgi:hypothetical protein